MGAGLGGDWNALNYASDPLFLLLKGKHSPPSTLATHMCLCSPSQSQAASGTQPLGRNTVSLQRNLTLLPRGSVGLGLRSPAACPLYRLKASFQTRVQALLRNYSMGCPCPRTRQPLLLFHLVINIIVNIAINST